MTAATMPAAAALVRHEARRCGPGVWVLPAAGAAVGAGAALFPAAALPVLLAAAGTALAGLAALCVVAMLGRERMPELQAALPVGVPVLVARRLALLAASAGAAGAAAGGGAFASAAVPPGAPGALGAVVEAAATGGSVLCTGALLGGVALCTWARWHSAAASGALAAVWLGHALLWAPNVPPELDVPVSAAVGAVLIRCGLRALADPEKLLAGGPTKEAR